MRSAVAGAFWASRPDAVGPTNAAQHYANRFNIAGIHGRARNWHAGFHIGPQIGDYRCTARLEHRLEQNPGRYRPGQFHVLFERM